MKDEILLFAVEGGVLTDYIQSLTSLGLKLRAVDIAPCAAYRSLRRGGSEGRQGGRRFDGQWPSAHLGFGAYRGRNSSSRGEDLVFYKHIDIGGKTINQAVAAKLGISVPEALQMRARIMTPPAPSDDSSDDDVLPLSQAV